MTTLQLDSFVQLLSWICFTSVLLGHLVYDILCYFGVKLVRFLLQRARSQCTTK